MPAIMIKPTTETKILTRTDRVFGKPDDPEFVPTHVVIGQASEGEVGKRAKLYSNVNRKLDGDGDLVVSQDVSFWEVKRLEIFLTLKDSNLQKSAGEDKPTVSFFTFPLTWDVFVDDFGKLHPIVADEIHEKVLEVNAVWAMGGE